MSHANDWTHDTAWEDETNYSRNWVVNQAHPQASDDNPGTEQLPLSNIQSAVDQAQAGEKIIIHQGRYRERITLARGGQAKDQMLAIEAAPGAEVIISGSQIYRGLWDQPKSWDEGYLQGQLTPSMSQKVWCSTVPG